jgi:DNA-binding NarL/FixJ family response regulator
MRKIQKADTVASPKIERSVFKSVPKRLQVRFRLTPRQIEVVDCVFLGMGIKGIASFLEISESGVKKHLRKIYRRVKAQSMARAVYILLNG